ncbi:MULTISPECIES: thioredoxin family protein [Sutcliffiella]|uniref:Thiol reductase thioredoxin n=1 Tax=Sutcliffiella cohnii TaxID=33932 RepID=A0A223KLK5_9BACI|nr:MULTISPECIES: thioredoxin family protein [Sutcliffiella]AST90342.1 thiol reductase thioredoxin [Sutcliffiella cohnii]MED4017555.1 thioredoxin family protein [Sutcliffiella cohnii]WBL15995.1 thioredoxin family protein [Sutcliffiella sp. NC1]
MKKIIAIISVIVVVFGAIAFITNYQQKEQSKGNPYGKDVVHPETVKILGNPLYENVILPDDLEENLNNNVPTTVYFFAPDCQYCQLTTPILVPLAEEMDVNVQLYNLREFEEGWNDYAIRATPTLIHFVDGKEVNRVEGYQEEPVFEQWLEQIKEETASES